MADNTLPPFSTPSTNFVNFAQQMQQSPMAGRAPVSSFGLTPGQSALGPSHAALQQKLGVSLDQSNGIQSLLAQLIANPDLAKQMGGLTSGSYTPDQPAGAWRLNFNGPGDGSPGGATGYGHGFGANSPLFGQAGAPPPAPSQPSPQGQKIDGPPMPGPAPEPVDPATGLTATQSLIARLLAGGGSGGGSANGNSGAAGGGSAGG